MSTSRALHLAKLAAILACVFISCSASGQIRLTSTKQLFLDDFLIAEKENVERAIHPAEKFRGNPVLRATEPWEGPVAIVYGSVIQDRAKYKVWYLAYGKDGTKGVGYAESDDGIGWIKPQLDFHKVDGQPTNLLITGDTNGKTTNVLPFFAEAFGVHKDTKDPDPSRRYKMGYLSIHRGYRGPREDPFHRGQRRGLGVAASPDGIHWKLVDSWTTEAICDGATHWMYDAHRGQYVLYGRTKFRDPDLLEAWQDDEWVKRYFWGRAVARIESKDFIHWNHEAPASAPVVMAPDIDDPPGTEIYSMCVFPYESVYIGLVQVFHNQPETCHLDIQLAVSRDGVQFERVGDRRPFLPVGEVGSWDRFNLSLANNPPVVVGDKLRFYYGGRNYRHSPYQGQDKGAQFGGVGFATVERDRLVSLQASFDGGVILTRPLRIGGDTICLNAKSDFGSILLEVLNPEGQLIARSTPIRENQIRIPVDWTNGQPDLTDQPVQLRIRLENAQLYALWCE
jgi:hypothetical protein